MTKSDHRLSKPHLVEYMKQGMEREATRVREEQKRREAAEAQRKVLTEAFLARQQALIGTATVAKMTADAANITIRFSNDHELVIALRDLYDADLVVSGTGEPGISLDTGMPQPDSRTHGAWFFCGKILYASLPLSLLTRRALSSVFTPLC